VGPAAGASAARVGGRVLLVDDEADVAESLRDLLESRGYVVDTAHSATQACEQALSFRPQVALVEIRLGRASGIDLLSGLRRPNPSLLCVTMAAHADVEMAVQALTQGAYHCLRKPIDARELLATLERCFERIRLEAEKAAAEAELRARNTELAEINARLRQVVEAAGQLAACNHLEGLSHRLLDEVARIMAAEGGSLFFRHEGGFERVCSLDEGHVPLWLAAPFPEQTVFGRALRERRPVVIRDIDAESGIRPSGWAGYRDGSLVVFPIEIDGEVRALLSLHNKRWPPFTEQDRELGQVLISLSAEILRVQQASDSVRTSEERYRLLAENVTDVIWTTDSNGNVTYVSPSVERETGYTPGEVLAMGLERLLAPTSLSTALQVLEEEQRRTPAPGEGWARRLDLEIVRKDGTSLWAEVTVTALAGNRPGEFLGVARDVTARRQAEEQLARLATAVEQAGEEMILTDAYGVIQYVNPAFERLTGYSREEAVGQTPRILKSGVHDQAFYRSLWTTISSGETWAGRLTNRRKDGSHVIQEATISPIRDPAGRITGYVAAKRDVTRQVGLETRVAQTEKMEAIGRLAGGIAHDFNNVLSAILGFVDLADLAERSNPAPGNVPRYLHGIREAGNRAAELTRQILTFSRQAPQEMRPVEARSVVDEALKLMRAALPSTIEIRRSLASDAAVMADPTQIHQVVVNLCTNAGLAMREGGVLELTLEDVELDAAFAEAHAPVGPGQFVHLSVRDTGCGIAPDMLARIFEPFYTTRPKGEGTGLGLAVVHGIVRNHGGLISVESAPGSGATFHVYLPAIPVSAVRDPSAVKELPRGRSERVLFVDDEEIQVELAKELLQELGYEVTGARSAAEALAIFRARPEAVDIVVTDTTMPGMTGDVLAGDLLRLRPGLPVLLCTGFSERVSEARARAIGVRQLLMKPFSLEDLASAIRRALDSRPEQS
jgi:PAS domain S-box-containing protein